MIVRSRKREAPDPEASPEYWMTYSDLMANLLMIFGLIICVTMMLAAKEQKDQLDIIEGQRHKLTEQQAALENLASNAAERLGFRKRIIEKLREKLARYDVKVDPDTGAILIAAAVLFEQGDARVTGAGADVLNSVMSAYTAVLFSDEFRPSLSRIIIEGHTNDDGGYVFNLDLSQRRAFSVMKHLLDQYSGGPMQDLLKQYTVASGRSLVDLIRSAGEVDKVRSRRIEIKFSLKDDETIRELAAILEGNK